MVFHKPILLKEVIEGLNIQPEGVYVDMTFGGGGHSGAILEKLGANGRLVSFDQDEDALANAVEDRRLTLLRSNFRYAHRFLRLEGYEKVDGIMADIGVSSFQFDEAGRGFSYRYDKPLDMRMNRKQHLTAQDVLNNYDEGRLLKIFSGYGEIRNSRQLAARIIKFRKDQKIVTGGDLQEAIDDLIRGDRNRYLAQLYQAIRIEVNDEIEALKEMLEASKELLKPGGRLVILSFHSLEDRIAKKFIKTGNVEGLQKKDAYGRVQKEFVEVIKGIVQAGEEEQKINPRSKSAKLRIAEKI